MNFGDLSLFLARALARAARKKALQFKLQIQITQNKYGITFRRFTLSSACSATTKILNLFRHWTFFRSTIFFSLPHTLNCHRRVCTFCSCLMCRRAIILTFCYGLFFWRSQKAALDILQMNSRRRRWRGKKCRIKVGKYLKIFKNSSDSRICAFFTRHWRLFRA